MPNHIQPLPPQVANQIAAGEVVERPASVVKELVENSLDAGATHIVVRIEKAGRKRIEVEDDGCGMSAVDAPMAMQRHATSKITSLEDLHRIASHGFRGEALPSIASVSRFRMHTCLRGEKEGMEVRVDGGGPVETRPAPARAGTRIEVLDLFLNTPARLRFMRTDKTEEAWIIDAMRALALASPQAAFRLEVDGRRRLSVPAGQGERERVVAIMGDEFAENSIEQASEYEGVRILAQLGLPTFHHHNSSRMLFIVNGRVVRDRQLIAALRAGYRDVMFHDRYPVALLRIDMDPRDLDVNVHPAKREVRFRSPQGLRAGIVACVRAGIEHMGHTVSSQTGSEALRAMQSSYRSAASGFPERARPVPASPAGADIRRLLFSSPGAAEPEREYTADVPLDLGQPLAQIHRCYILAQTDDGIVLVDQHAAHERITYEKMKAELGKGGLASQMLLTPAGWRTDATTAAWLHTHAGGMAVFGVDLEAAGEESFSIRAVPAMLADESPQQLLDELVEACMLVGIEAEGYGRVLERWLGNRACKSSIKSGRALSPEEQEGLLREMERTPNIGQCNHGRPTYVWLSLTDLERLFGRRE
ncbi:MAG: DNA mismatch repair endonuclease MutL [Mariprofundaceae bacterium]|nr:DNA mismatch repair endonuclease MutL [Mariprofundaceae bacterium]